MNEPVTSFQLMMTFGILLANVVAGIGAFFLRRLVHDFDELDRDVKILLVKTIPDIEKTLAVIRARMKAERKDDAS